MKAFTPPIVTLNGTPDVTVTAVQGSTPIPPCPIRQIYIDVFGMYVGGIGTIALVGLAFNVINITLLRHQRSNINSILLLQYLAVTDILFLLVCFAYFPLRHLLTLIIYGDEIFKDDDWYQLPHILSVVHPLFYITQNFRNWTVVLITIDRFLSIAFPLWARSALTKQRLKVAFIVLGVVSAWPARLWLNMYFRPYFNKCFNREAFWMDFKFPYFGYYYTFTTVVIPMMLIYLMNIILIYVMRRSYRTRAKLRQQKQDSKQQRQVNAMVISMMVVFTLCETLACVDRLMTAAGMKFPKHSKFKNYSRKLGLLLNVVDSAFNFLAYCASNPSFRRGFLNLIGRKQKNSITETSQTSVAAK